MKKEIFEVIQYFDIFDYAPSEEEIYRYLSIKTTNEALELSLTELCKSTKLYAEGGMYSMPHRGELIKDCMKKKKITQEKIKTIQKYLKVMQHWRYIYGIGLSGSCSMNNAQDEDDIDLFIISAPGGMWTARCIAIFIAKLHGKHRTRRMNDVRDTICLNLYFEYGHLTVPKSKRNVFTAHEVAQMKPMYMKKGVYEAFIHSNAWIKEYFPNMTYPHASVYPASHVDKGLLGGMVERMCRTIQKTYMRSHITHEHISDHQLWFFPRDAKKRVEQRIDLTV